MARRPKRTLSEELKRHEQIAIALMTGTEALAGLYPDIPALATAQTLLELARKEFGKRTETATRTTIDEFAMIQE